MSSSKIDIIKEMYPDEEFLIADGFDDAIIGVDEENGKIIYDIDEIINILIIDGMDVNEAIEFYEYNISGSYVGEKTPVFMRKIIEL
jgi:hypothetical protein